MEKSSPRTARKMHQTTLRFGEDLWGSLELEAERAGVSVAQYVRDAALQRLSYEAGRRDEVKAAADVEAAAPSVPAAAARARERAGNEVSQSDALYAQGNLARRRAVELRSRSETTRARLGLHKT